MYYILYSKKLLFKDLGLFNKYVETYMLSNNERERCTYNLKVKCKDI